MAMSPQERKARTGSVQKSKSQGSPTQRNKKDPPKRVSKPTKSPVQRDRDNQKNEVAKQKLLQELNVPTTSSFSRADNVGLGSLDQTKFLPNSYGDVYQGGPYPGQRPSTGNVLPSGPTNATNYGLGPIDQTKFLPSSYDGYQGDPTVSTKSNNFFGGIDTNKVAADPSAVGTKKNVDPVSTVPNIPGGFTDEVAAAAGPSELVKTIEDLATFKKGGKDDVKNIMSKVRDMEKAIDGSVQLSNYDKLQYKSQIRYARENFAKMGYSLNEVMAAVGTNAFNKMVSKTPISRDDAAARGQLDEVQRIMDKYGRPAVVRKDGTIGAMSPNFRQFGQDIRGGFSDLFDGFSGLSKFTPTGILANLFSGIGKNQSTANAPGGNYRVREPQEQKFGFGDIPSGANQFLKDGYAQYINSPINLSDKESTPFMAPSAPVAGARRALANAMRSGGGGGGGQQTQNQGGDGGGGSGDADPGPLTYQTYAKPVSYNYFGGPEQIYLGGGYQQDGKTIGPFGYANGGIANFKPYGY